MSFTNFGTGKSESFGGTYLELTPHEKLRYTDRFDDPNLPGEMQVTIMLKPVACGTDVEIVSNGPRISLGASGFGSHISMWLGPPRIQRRMTFLVCFGLLMIFAPTGAAPAAAFVAPLASARSKSASDKPPRPIIPNCKKLRRDGVSVLRASAQPS